MRQVWSVCLLAKPQLPALRDQLPGKVAGLNYYGASLDLDFTLTRPSP